jgi:phospholipid/cholesterol/gamma-HCH transport system ATP-binding protein
MSNGEQETGANGAEKGPPPPAEREPHIEVRGLSIGYEGKPVQQDLTFTVRRGDIFVIMGGSGSGKSTLLRAMIGLIEPLAGEVLYDGESFTRAEREERARMLRNVGVLYQRDALWSDYTLAENIELVLDTEGALRGPERAEIVSLKLALVGLAGFEEFLPAQLSGGMRKRAGLARAMALDPDILFFDEPSAGLDPPTSRRLDELIVELRESLGATIVLVTHELASLLAIGDNGVFLDNESGTMIAQGSPRELLERSTDERVQRFLRREKAPPRNAAKGRR